MKKEKTEEEEEKEEEEEENDDNNNDGIYLLDYIITTHYFYSEDGSAGFCDTLLPICQTRWSHNMMIPHNTILLIQRKI
jgi:hypothetical protein